MSFRKDVEKELEQFKVWAQDVNMQAHLAKSGLQAEVRTAWMEAQQSVAKLEAKVEELGEAADQGLESALEQLKANYQKLKSSLKN